ncbi:hypothetical protein AYO44_12145 [Planctomycetaceae bacterium SCGC AG-212-F19]|nr:hypothetical protein AYO44_12145 [Planctomycetaceae bacterium SCGC AG-212-F19]
MALGLLSLIGGLTAIPAVAFGVAVMVAARRDLREMGKGLMDPDGELLTRQADWAAMRGLVAVVVFGMLGLALVIQSVLQVRM